jgi:hypothetical protein
MRTTVKTDDAELARKARAADESLRENYAGLDPDTFIQEVERSLTELDVALPPEQVRAYAQHISDRADFELTLP